MRVIEEIARGGFGIVEKVELAHDAVAARKRFAPRDDIAHGRDPAKLRARFVREVRVQEALRSSAFLPILEHHLDGDEPWYLMPLADRNFLTEIVNCRSTSTVPSAALADILNGLDELHSLGYVHRDLKPENILLHDGVWKLGDFGLVMIPEAETERRLTSTDSVWGTLIYASPEQAGGMRSVTPASDIYSFGCILHDVFDGTKRIPLQRHSCSGPVGAIIEKCTEAQAERRFKNIRGLRAALAAAISDQQPAAHPTSLAARAWIARVANVAQWIAGDVADLTRDLANNESADDRDAILRSLDEEVLTRLHQIDPVVWQELSLCLCQWAHGSFAFEFCDVLIRRLECLFALGSLEVKAAVAIAAAELGASHNRWFVMQKLVAMCGPRLDDRAAARISIEIRAEQAAQNFYTCADRISLEPTAYHPLIAVAVVES